MSTDQGRSAGAARRDPAAPAPKHQMSPGDKRLIAALTLLRDELGPVVDEIAFGELPPADRRALARAMRKVADALEPEPVVLVPPDDHTSP